MMRHALANENWTTLTPDSYEWLDKVKLAGGDATVAGAHHVVAVKGDADDKDAFKLQASKLPDATQKKILDGAKAVNWRTGAGALHLSVDGMSYTLVSLSSVKTSERQIARQLGLDAAKAIKELKLTHVALCAAPGLDAVEVFDGLAAGYYNCAGFKGTRKRDITRLPAQVTLAGTDVTPQRCKEATEFARAAAFTRFLQDAPANYLDPVKFGEIAADVAKARGLKCKVLDKAAMQKLGMHLFLSVADGGPIEPRTIAIEIDGKDNSKCVTLVGKGLTFDSGGISIKPSAGMEEMKYDMSGGAAVLGTAHFLAAVKPPTKVVCLIGASENMPSGTATKPGDLVRAMNGKTVEVLNTDAEGRLVLADVLHYGITEYKPDLIVDIATLTGAVLVALGCVGSALLSNDQDTARYVLKVAEGAGEPMWQLPLWPELEKETKGDVGDLKNIAKPSVKGGSIMGGMFLKEFVGNTKWAHLDIAGTGWNCQALGYPSSGSSAFGLRTLVGTCLNYGQ
jgi:leucyl aminopeptidase